MVELSMNMGTVLLFHFRSKKEHGTIFCFSLPTQKRTRNPFSVSHFRPKKELESHPRVSHIRPKKELESHLHVFHFRPKKERENRPHVSLSPKNGTREPSLCLLVNHCTFVKKCCSRFGLSFSIKGGRGIKEG